jgi:glycosyltransferase involved in cell wall biosynthesis
VENGKMEQMIKVSIITVCYNSVGTIKTALESVFAQKNVDLEYIVVDGGSKDGTVDVLKEYAEKTLNSQLSTPNFTFRWISESDQGMYDAINKGIGMATGDIVGILNADDVLASDDSLAKISSEFRVGSLELGECVENGDQKLECRSQGLGVDAVYADIRFVNKGSSVEQLRSAKSVRYCSAKYFRPWMFRFAVMVPHPSFYCRRELFEKYGAYSLDYRICADFELVMRYMWKHRIRTRYINECVVVMRTGGVSTSGIKSNMLINQEDLKALKSNGYWSALWLIYLKYFFKIWGYVFKR